MLLRLLIFAGLASSEAIRSRRLEHELIAGYHPLTEVTSVNAIDLDQAAMESQLSLATTESMSNARAFYEEGGYSENYALLTLNTPLTADVPRNAIAQGKSHLTGTEVYGLIIEAASIGDTQVKFLYATTDVQAHYVDCRVGALPRLSQANLDGCLSDATDAEVSIAGAGTYTYTYTIRKDNKNDRTFQLMSRKADEQMYKCANCPYRTFKKFHEYYGSSDYADQWIIAAFEGTKTSFTNGNVDFDNYQDVERAAAIKQGTVALNLWMHVIRYMEDAVDECTNTNKEIPARSWDSAVALYTGSMEGIDGAGVGKLLHSLADKGCNNFKTCGEKADRIHGHAYVTQEIFKDFTAGAQQIANGQCNELLPLKVRIENRMAVPLVQGVLRMAYIQERLGGSQADEATGAALAAGILPLVNDCSAGDANTVYGNMKVGSSTPNFVDVKKALENNYACMGIKCGEVGGLWDDAATAYFDDADPCDHTDDTEIGANSSDPNGGGGSNVGAALGVSFGLLAVALIAVIYFLKKRQASSKMAPEAGTEFNGGVQQEQTAVTAEVEVREMT